MDARADLSLEPNSSREGNVNSFDEELFARLARLRSELNQSKKRPGNAQSIDVQLDVLEQRLDDAERSAQSLADTGTRTEMGEKAMCLLTVNSLEAELCLAKPRLLLYPTWIRLREKLYRLGEERRESWKEEIANSISENADEASSNRLRQYLRQLTLELHESAARYNRLNEERAAVMHFVYKQGGLLVLVYSVVVIVCIALSSCPFPVAVATILSLLAGASSGGMGAVFSRLQTLRRVRTRRGFEDLLKADMVLRTIIGFGAALIVAAVLLSESLPFIRLPEEPIPKIALLVVFGFSAGFSDRLFSVMLSQVIGARAPSSPRGGN